MIVTKRTGVKRSLAIFVVLVMVVLQGCESGGADNTEEIVALQQQVAVLTRQVEDAQEKIGTLRDTMQDTNRELFSLRTEVDRLKEQAVPPPPPARTEPPKEQEPAQATATPRNAETISCSQVWKLLGQGKDVATVAQTLKVTTEVVRACEEQVGRGRPPR